MVVWNIRGGLGVVDRRRGVISLADGVSLPFAESATRSVVWCNRTVIESRYGFRQLKSEVFVEVDG